MAASVTRTFRDALERVIEGGESESRQPCPEAEVVVGVAAVLAPMPIPLSLFASPRLSAAGVTEAFRRLTDASLVAMGKTESGQDALSVSPLVREMMRERFDTAGLTHANIVTSIYLLISAFP